MKRRMIKKIVSVLLIVAALVSFFTIASFSVKNSYDGLTSAKTPTSKGTLKFAKKLGEGYAFAPTSPVVTDDAIVVMSGKKLFKLNKENGEIIASAVLANNNTYTVVSPCVANGMIFVQLNDGIIQAFDYDSLTPLWKYTDPLGGQSLCNIVYSGGYIYTGFWNGETTNANYVRIDVKDENPKKTDEAKKADWTYTSKGGFYLTDACITSNFVVLACANGVKDDNSNSKVVSLKKTTGKLVSSMAVKGDTRSAVIYDSTSKKYFILTKGGYLYSFSMNSSSGAFSAKKSLSLSGAATGAPVVYNGRVYFGASNGSSGGRFYAVDAESLSVIYYATLEGYPQASPLISTAYGNKWYIYITVNYKPGSIFVFADSANQNTADKTLLFSPPDNYSQYCISRIAAGDDGTLYYKNDSGAIFAVSEKSENIIVAFFNRIIASFSRLFGLTK